MAVESRRRRAGATEAIRQVTALLGELVVSAGVLVLLFVVWQLWWTGIGADRDARAAVASLHRGWGQSSTASTVHDDPSPPTARSQGDPPAVAEPGAGTPFAIVHVPRFGAGWVVAAEQGVDVRSVLDHGVLGHYPGTAMPGGPGNFSVAGHRTTYGHPMKDIAELAVGDPIVVESADDWYVYSVTGHEVVAPSDVSVIAPVPGGPPRVDPPATRRLMTITACHPEYSARQRYVVHAELTSWQPRTAGVPSVLATPDGAVGGSASP